VGCCSCWAGRNRCGFRASRPRGYNLVYLIYSVNRHDRFRHLLAIVVDFLKIEKVELTVFEKARLNGPETAQN